MSILIRGMEMPKEGSWVTLRVFPDGQCFLYSWCGNDFDFMEHLTAVPVPPHGRLGDLDAVAAEIQKAIDNMEYSYPYLLREEQSQREHGMVFARDIVCDAPTIIPAEEGE
jgi:hypothetical protein